MYTCAHCNIVQILISVLLNLFEEEYFGVLGSRIVKELYYYAIDMESNRWATCTIAVFHGQVFSILIMCSKQIAKCKLTVYNTKFLPRVVFKKKEDLIYLQVVKSYPESSEFE